MCTSLSKIFLDQVSDLFTSIREVMIIIALNQMNDALIGCRTQRDFLDIFQLDMSSTFIFFEKKTFTDIVQAFTRNEQNPLLLVSFSADLND